MELIIDAVNRFVWGFPALVLILSIGVILSVRTKWVQFRLFPAALRNFFGAFFTKKRQKGVSSYNALCMALAATVGTGNLAGVGGAIAIGGPGAIFWMWISALLGMATKFAEATLSVRYRVKDVHGAFVGGPMHIVQQSMGPKWQIVASIYCFFGVVAAFGVGSATQINAALGGIHGAIRAFGGQESTFINLLFGMGVSVLVILVYIGGANRISSIISYVVPFASLFYILLCMGVLAVRADVVADAFLSIVKGAFCPRAVTGGVLGSTFQALRIGISRGVFTNEAGMGTAGMAHGSAQVSHPVEQGLMGIVEVFLDTIIICTLTALVILCSGVSIPYGQDLGIRITANAFSCIYGSWIHIPIAISLFCFAFATILGWGLYGMRCAQFLFGEKAWNGMAYMLAFSVIVGVVIRTGTVWSMSELANGLMAIPNLIILIYHCPELVRLVKEYNCLHGRHTVNGGTYENFRKSKSVRFVSNAEVSSLGRKG